MFGFNFPPRGWALCNGQQLSIAQNTALFSLLGTTYGGDGQTMFALPNLQGRVPIHFGQGAGLANYNIGQAAGQETVTLLVTQMPAHTHVPNCQTTPANQQNPLGGVWATEAAGATALYSNSAPNATMSPTALTNTGGSQPHSILQPYLVVNFCIALVGIFPPRD